MRFALAALALILSTTAAFAGPRTRSAVRHRSYTAQTVTPAGIAIVHREHTVTRGGAIDALGEVNAARASRGLPPFAWDAGLTAAAQAAADFRAANRITGHVGGPRGDFTFLPAGTHAAAAGCGALEPSWGWGSCCTYEAYRTAGAAVTWGADGRRYMHLFVR